jgi:subtilisin family serine protease
MRKSLFNLSLFILILLSSLPVRADIGGNNNPQHSLIIKFKSARSSSLNRKLSSLNLVESSSLRPLFSKSNISGSFKTLGLKNEKDIKRQQKIQTIESDYGFDRFYQVNFKSRKELKKAKKLLRNNSQIESVEEDVIVFGEAPVNDTFYNLPDTNPNSLWGVKAINSAQAWDINLGEGSVVAVLDTGVDYNLPELWDNIWVNPLFVTDNNSDGTINLNDLDVAPKDGKLYGSELTSIGGQFIFGRDYINNDSDPMDDHLVTNNGVASGGHGTHVSGTIAAIANNNIGIAGVSPRSKIMPLKVLDSSKLGTLGAVANAIRQAADNGADVINMSLSAKVSPAPQYFIEAVNYAQALGSVIVVAAGNDSDNAEKYTPANIPSVITVAALAKDKDSNNNFKAATFSNYGSPVDISAPGVNILSLSTSLVKAANPSDYVLKSGTSMAAPHVAGVAALLKASEPALTPSQINQRIKSSFISPTTPSGQLSFMRTYFTSQVKPMLNSFRALSDKAVGEISLVNLDTQLIQGTASAGNFARYELSYMPNLDGSVKTTLFKGFSPVINGNLLSNNLTLDRTKENFLILEVFDNAGKIVAFDAKKLDAAPLKTNTTITLTPSGSASVVSGQAITFTATVTGSNPTGSVTFKNNGTDLGSPVTLTGTGNTKTATLPLSFTTAGTANITVSYAGDANNNSSNSATTTVTITVPKTNTTITLTPSGSASVVSGQTVTFTATITGSNPSGNVIFKNNGVDLRTVALTGSGNTKTTTLPLSFTTAGTANITVSYAGDANNNSSTSVTTTVTII